MKLINYKLFCFVVAESIVIRKVYQSFCEPYKVMLLISGQKNKCVLR